jgi:NAD(P)-dependent dehydrogenase (short-subunit alcohol dehydrogenase family)
MRELRGRTAVVTGAASGIGRALCVAFAQQGCRIVLADIERAPLEAAADELRAAGAECLAVPTDVADADSVAALADAAVRAFGGVHIAVNNAGVSVRKPMAEFTLDDWRWTLGVDLWGTIHGVHAFLPLLREQPEAHLVNTASVAGLTPFPLGGAYNAAKAAVVALTETLFLELQAMAPHVGVSVLCPGATRSNFVSSARNRPAALGTSTPPAPGNPLLAQNEVSAALIAQGMAPEKVAEHVIAAIRERRFWVLTHLAEYGPAIRARVEGMLAGDDPRPVDIAAILARD